MDASERVLVGAAGRACSRASAIQSGRERQHSKLGWRGGCFFGVLPTWRSFGSRRSWYSWERLGGRVPERASSKAVASASTPSLGGGAAVFWSASGLPELWIASERVLVGAAGRACSRAYVIQSGSKRASASTPNLGGEAAVFWSASGLPELWTAPERELVGGAERACSRACVIQSCRKRQHSKLGWRSGCVLECFRLAGALDCVGAGTRRSGWEGVFPSLRHPKLSPAPALQTWVAGRLCLGVLPACPSFGRVGAGTRRSRLGGRVPEPTSSKAVASASTPSLGGEAAVFWSASDMAELWIASELVLVGAAGRACSRACVIQSCRKRQHSKLGWRNGCVLECFRLAGALDCAGAGTRYSTSSANLSNFLLGLA